MSATATLGGPPTVTDLHAEARIEFERGVLADESAVGLVFAIDRLDELTLRLGAGGRARAIAALRALVDEAVAELPGTRTPVFVERPDGWFVLVPRTDRETGQALAKRLVDVARDDARLPTVSAGLSYDARRAPIFFETLLEVAERGAEVAAAGGGDRLAQTDLYRLVQRRCERDDEATRRQQQARAKIGAAELPQRAAEEASRTIDAWMDPDEAEARADHLLSELEAQEASLGQSDAARERLAFEQQALADLKALEEAKNREHRQEVERLERRIAKLASALESAEGQITRLAQVKSIDPGVASVYHSVQGIDPEDAQRELKKELLETVFVSNRQLLEMIASRR